MTDENLKAEIERLREGVKTLRAYIANPEGEGPVRYAEALDLADDLLGDLPLSASSRTPARTGNVRRRWCGICFLWREEADGRCVHCGNAHMTDR